jgi:hypothetical protein
MRIGRRNRSTRRKPAPVPLRALQIPRNLTWDWTGAAAIRWRLSYGTALFKYIYEGPGSILLLIIDNTDWGFSWIIRISSKEFLINSSCPFLAWLILRQWRWRRYVSAKHLLNFNELHEVMPHKVEFFLNSSVRVSDYSETTIFSLPLACSFILWWRANRYRNITSNRNGPEKDIQYVREKLQNEDRNDVIREQIELWRIMKRDWCDADVFVEWNITNYRARAYSGVQCGRG